MKTSDKTTPLLQQYYQLKEKLTDRDLLLFQVGDFFETFGKDAEKFAHMARITLTSKNSLAMAGIPIKQYNKYVQTILQGGYNVVLAEQTAPPSISAKSKLLTRSITKKITWGTWVEENSDDYRFVLAIIAYQDCYYAVYGDCKTQEGFFEEIIPTYLHSFINRINPVYIISNCNIINKLYNTTDDFILSEQYGKIFLNIKDFTYQKEHLAPKLLLVRWIEDYFKSCGFTVNLSLTVVKKQQMYLGANVLKNLEILHNFNRNGKSLIDFLDHTQSPMGHRILKQQLSLPSANESLIKSYWESVKKLMTCDVLDLRIADLSRLVHNGRTIKNIYKLAQNIEKSLNILTKIVSILPKFLHCQISHVQKIDIHRDILQVIKIKPATQTPYIHSSRAQELHYHYQETLKHIFNFTNDYNINGSIKYNGILGYFIETKGKLSNRFILKQGLVKVNRYTHPDLIQLESQLSLYNNQIQEYETEFLQQLYKQIQINKDLIVQLSYIIGVCDYLHSNSIAARQNCYSCPVINTAGLKLTNGKHPLLTDKVDVFVTNQVDLQNKRNLIITGPNMGGKSTLLKTVGLQVIMAQAGMFVPGQLEVPIFHEIFVRIGAHDNITRGESTFMVEMKECAEIVSLATANSLVLIDELGRGTAIKDGLSLAIVISLQLLEKNQSTNLIATHYHELAHYFHKHYKDYFMIYHVLVKDNLILYKLIPGVSQSSFGLLVAKMAGLSGELINQAKTVFNNIELGINLNMIFNADAN